MDSLSGQQSYSGAPGFPPPMSGLQFGDLMGMAGRQPGGSVGGGGRPGMQEGPGLDFFQSLLQQLGIDIGEEGGGFFPGGGFGGISPGIGGRNLGQIPGGIGPQFPRLPSELQQPSPSFGAGGQVTQSPLVQTLGGGQTPAFRNPRTPSPVSGSPDPLSILTQILGVVPPGLRAVGSIVGSGDQEGTGNVQTPGTLPAEYVPILTGEGGSAGTPEDVLNAAGDPAQAGFSPFGTQSLSGLDAEGALDPSGQGFSPFGTQAPGSQSMQDTLGQIGAGAGGLKSLFELINTFERGIKPEDIQKIINNVSGIYSGATGAAGVSPIQDWLSSISPELAGLGTQYLGPIKAWIDALGSGLGINAPHDPGQNLGLSMLLSNFDPTGLTMPALAVGEFFNQMNLSKQKESGRVNNPIAGKLYSDSTAGIGRDLDLLKSIDEAGGIGNMPMEFLLPAISSMTNNILPYYMTAQGGKEPLRASDSMKGLYGRQGLGGQEQYTANFNRAQQGLAQMVENAMSRGATYEQLGQLPINQRWAGEGLDAAGTPGDYYAMDPWGFQGKIQQGMQEAYGPSWGGLSNTDRFGNPLQGGVMGADVMPGSEMMDRLTPGGQSADPRMYGGLLWNALARMNADPGTLAGQGGQIFQHFDPLAGHRGADLLSTLGMPNAQFYNPQLGGIDVNMMNPQQYEQYQQQDMLEKMRLAELLNFQPGGGG